MHLKLHGLKEETLNIFSTTKGEILNYNELHLFLGKIMGDSNEIEKNATETRQAFQEIAKVSEQLAQVAEVSTSL